MKAMPRSRLCKANKIILISLIHSSFIQKPESGSFIKLKNPKMHKNLITRKLLNLQAIMSLYNNFHFLTHVISLHPVVLHDGHQTVVDEEGH